MNKLFRHQFRHVSENESKMYKSNEKFVVQWHRDPKHRRNLHYVSCAASDNVVQDVTAEINRLINEFQMPE